VEDVYEQETPTYSFSKLKVLHIDGSIPIMQRMFVNCCSLTELHIDLNGASSIDSDSLRQLLINNARLENFSLCTRGFENILRSEDVDSYQFKLKSFKLACDDLSEADQGFVEKFLESQASSLEALYLDIKLWTELIKMVLEFTDLKDLILIKNSTDTDWEALGSSVNQNSPIENLRIDGRGSLLKLFLKSISVLKSLQVHNLDDISMREVAQRWPMLERLVLIVLLATKIDPSYFPQMKYFFSQYVDSGTSYMNSIRYGTRSNFMNLVERDFGLQKQYYRTYF
jgi:hypothetical protein